MSMPFSRGATENRYRLGIDLGSGSIGWAAVVDADGPSPQILGMGVRRFEAGVTGSADEIEAGKDKSRATVRRDARGPRRQTWRRQYRIRKVFHLLQRLGLLPDSDDDSHDTRNRVIADLDRQLRAEYLTGADHPAQQVLPYRLRAAALDEQVSRFARDVPFITSPSGVGFSPIARRARRTRTRARSKRESADCPTKSNGTVAGLWASTSLR